MTRAMSTGGIPATNFIYADKTDALPMSTMRFSRIGSRASTIPVSCPVILRQACGRGALGFDRMPKIVNPESGFLVNSNNTPLHGSRPVAWS